ncbi:MAG: sialate O-acetylesterase, partial [Leptospiraceae bacterium]|nr:sialate O-acetylesterase [Leptospiraceae bacterium]
APTVSARDGDNAIQAEHRGKLHLFVLAGQSNMSGRGKPLDQPLDNSIYLFGNDGNWKPAREPLDSCENQLDEVSCDEGAGTGPGLAFALELRKRRPDMAIGLIPCAKGATTIFEWDRRLVENSLYGNCLSRIRVASQMGEVKAVLFLQGEWDALGPSYWDRLLAPNHRLPEKLPDQKVRYSIRKSGNDANQREPHSESEEPLDYRLEEGKLIVTLKSNPQRGWNRAMPEIWGAIFEDFVTGLRHDLDRPGLPVVLAQIGDNHNPGAYIKWSAVQQQQEAITLEGIRLIRTRGLALRDNVHFTAESSAEIGKRFARAYLEQKSQDSRE